MKNQTKIIAVVIAVLAIVGVGYYVASNRSDQASQSAETVQEKTIAYTGQDGKSVCDLLKETHQVEVTESSMGEMVKSIDGLASTDYEFWLYSINNKPGEISCDKQMTTSSDQILWEYKGY